MLDVMIQSDKVVTESGIFPLDVGIRDGQIVSLATLGTGSEARRSIDARGQLVVPGGIDPHVHCSWPLMHEGADGPIYSGSPSIASRAALCGGTTTLLDFAVWKDGGTIADAVEQFEAKWAGNSYCDYSAHLMLLGDPPADVIVDLPSAVLRGYTSVKMFTTDVTPNRRGRMVRLGTIRTVVGTIAPCGGVAAIHAEDNDLVMQSYDDHIREGRVSFPLVTEVHSGLAEEVAIRRVLKATEDIPTARLYFMHVSSRGGEAALSEARAAGREVHGETLHHYSVYNREAYLRPNGQVYHTFPSLKDPADIEAIWRGIATGSIETIGTDAIITTLHDKLLGARIDDVTGGSAGVEPRMAVMYTEAVSKRGLSVQQWIDLTSRNAARIFGLYPRKGSLAPGSDADIAIFDISQERSVDLAHLHETDYSPWEGFRVTAWPVMTLLRGKVVFDHGDFSGSETDGKLAPRRTRAS